MNEEQKNSISVKIHGQRYKLKGEESPEYLQSIAHYVDMKMNDIEEKNPSLDVAKVAVLSAVNIADEYHKLKKEYDELLKWKENQTKE
ncbi:cell division protein ZapA [Caldalkalibacillus salinus]|uniref:cell division protein ZapA n=1 Tax=Caldalkalibacillus salinus TaxID=2803787 RepID=UPI0019214E5C